MAYFADLTPYSYIGSTNSELNVGWLQRDHPFDPEVPTEETLNRLWRFCSVPVKQTRGLHGCDRCPETPGRIVRAHRNGPERLLGSAEIRVFGRTPLKERLRHSIDQIEAGGVLLFQGSLVSVAVYAAPTLIYHYVESHHYKPPDEFLRALEEGPCPPSEQYFECLRKIGLDWKTL